MTKYVVAQNGVVINIVQASSDDTLPIYQWAVPDSQVVNVGDAFDYRSFSYDHADYLLGQVLFNHENRIRDIVRAIRDISSSVSGASAANTEGLPTTAASGDITGAQFKTGVLALLSSNSSAAWITPQNNYISFNKV